MVGKDYQFPVLLSSCRNEATDMVTYVYIWDDGSLSKKKHHRPKEEQKEYINEKFIRWAYSRIGTEADLNRFLETDWPGISLAKHLCNHNYHSVREVLDEMKRRMDDSQKRTDSRDRKMSEWNAQVADASDVVIGLDEISIMEKGIEVWLLLHTGYSLEQQRKLVFENRERLIKYIVRDLKRGTSSEYLYAVKMLSHVKTYKVAVREYNAAVFFLEFDTPQKVERNQFGAILLPEEETEKEEKTWRKTRSVSGKRS